MTRMPERSFFDRRYTFPGYTFVLLVILMNLKALSFVLSSVSNVLSGLFGVFLGFVTLLSGAPLGFLVSQTWYVIFNWRKESYVFKEEAPFDACTLLWRAYRSAEGSGNRKPTEEEKRRLVAISSNITHSWEPREDGAYITRRWDLLQLIGSTAVAIVWGVIVGLVVKKVIVDPNITLDPIQVSFLGMSFDMYCMLDWCVPITALLALLPLRHAYGKVLREHHSMFRFIIWSFLRIADLENDPQLKEISELNEKYVRIKRASDLHRNYVQNGSDDPSINEEHYREFLIFYSMLFFTCVVGIIELLPEFENLSLHYGIAYLVSLTVLYFGLLAGICYAMIKVPKLYAEQHYFKSKEFDFLRSQKGRIVLWIIIAVVFSVFTILYLVKIHFITV